MRLAKDFRAMARQALKGKWGIAVIAGLLANLLGVSTGGGVEFNFDTESLGLTSEWQDLEMELSQLLDSEMMDALWLGLGIGVAVSLVVGILFLVLGSVVGVGYAKFNLGLIDRQEEPELGTLFGYFKHWKVSVCANLLQGIYVFLWSLLLVIPGIYAAYGYAMTNYILAENPELTASEAIRRSKEMMEGNRWRLFCLQISFIGWSILCSFTAGIGYLWLNPYTQAATAAFYREVSGSAPIQFHEPVTPCIEDVL